MRRICPLVTMVALVALFAGCTMYGSPVVPPVGLAYSNVSAPQDADFDKTSLGSKKGEATVENVLGLFAWGDCSSQAAAKQGGIKTINGSDYQYYTVLGVYNKYTTVVYGD